MVYTKIFKRWKGKLINNVQRTSFCSIIIFILLKLTILPQFLVTNEKDVLGKKQTILGISGLHTYQLTFIL